MTDSGSCEITIEEVIGMQKFKGESLDNATARLLKQKGVPLVGTFNLKIAPGFVVTRTDYFDKHVFAWKKHDKQ